jgi:hypothetical protein
MLNEVVLRHPLLRFSCGEETNILQIQVIITDIGLEADYEHFCHLDFSLTA